jgi:hypothetical protein
MEPLECSRKIRKLKFLMPLASKDLMYIGCNFNYIDYLAFEAHTDSNQQEMT